MLDGIQKKAREISLAVGIAAGAMAAGAFDVGACVSVGPSRFNIDGKTFVVQFPKGKSGGVGEVIDGDKNVHFEMKESGEIIAQEPGKPVRRFMATSFTRSMVPQSKIECGDLNLEEKK